MEKIDIVDMLNAGAPCSETWEELASRTNRERNEAAKEIVRLREQVALLQDSPTWNDVRETLEQHGVPFASDALVKAMFRTFGKKDGF